MTKDTIRLLQLYPRDMNIYGDWGNTLVLQKRLERRGYTVELLEHNVGDTFPTNVDIIVGGGGQDSGQSKIEKDLLQHASTIKRMADDGVPMLLICGLYQQFGNYYTTSEGKKIDGIKVLDVETNASNERMIGNIVTHSKLFGEIIGYENHSGKTTLGAGAQAFGTVVQGAGNNGADDTEGAVSGNVIGTYMHGSILPKNPAVADWLIQQALARRGITTPLLPIDDTYAEKAREIALTRPR